MAEEGEGKTQKEDRSVLKEGWLLDLYTGRSGEIVIWVKTKNGETLRLLDHWLPKIYIGADDKYDLEYLSKRKEIMPYVEESAFEEKIEKITDTGPSQVLRLTVKDAGRIQYLARIIENLAALGIYRIYNADIRPEQSYLYEKNIFPLALIQFEKMNGDLNWTLKDDIWSLDYEVPPLTKILLEVKVNNGSIIPKFTDPIKQITISEGKEEIHIENGSEENKLNQLTKVVQEINPDIIFTEDGDTFTLPYLAKRAQTHNMDLFLSRELKSLRPSSRSGTTYFSYGRTRFKPATIKLHGRIHIDKSNTYIIDSSDLEGLYEVSRICRIPLHTTARASIGKCMSSLQFYYAYQKGILVPWKPVIAEHFKTRLELLTADRGGFTFEPAIGVHENVGELDFASLYPNIMYKKNISCETIRCRCCPDSTNIVPELDWNTCQKRRGIVPTALEILLWKRAQYKQLRTTNSKNLNRYESRQAALKWILVTSFGYLGFNNAKFGRIDAHIAVCAWDRMLLIETSRIAERSGYQILHGIVDSLWLKKEDTDEEDYYLLTQKIEEKTGFAISFEGIYKWITFQSSKLYNNIPVINRYFGVFKDGKVKIRGLEARRHDTPPFLKRCQTELITLLSKANTTQEVRKLIPKCKELFRRQAYHLYENQVKAKDLLVTIYISKEPHEYVNQTLESIVLKQLTQEGLTLNAGQKIRYLITKYYSKQPIRRAKAEQLIEEDTEYDSKRYIELLSEAYASVLKPFGCDRKDLLNTLTTEKLENYAI